MHGASGSEQAEARADAGSCSSRSLSYHCNVHACALAARRRHIGEHQPEELTAEGAGREPHRARQALGPQPLPE